MIRRNLVTVLVVAFLLAGCAFGGKSERATPIEQPQILTPSSSTGSSSLAIPPSDYSSGNDSNAVVNRNVTGTVSSSDEGLSISDQPTVNDYPYGTATPAQDNTVIEGTDGNLYSANGKKTDPDYQSDVASCHYYAQGLVAHDARVEEDRGGSFGDSLGGGTSSFLVLRQNIGVSDVKKRQAIHFNRCMKTKGYYQR